MSGKGKAPKGSDESESEESEPSDRTIPYNEWRSDTVNWDAYGDVTSQPHHSRRKQPTPSGPSADDDEDGDEDGDDPAYSDDEDSEDSE